MRRALECGFFFSLGATAAVLAVVAGLTPPGCVRESELWDVEADNAALRAELAGVKRWRGRVGTVEVPPADRIPPQNLPTVPAEGGAK